MYCKFVNIIYCLFSLGETLRRKMMEEIGLEREKNLDELEILGIRSEKLKKMANERLNKARSTTPARGSDLLIKQSPVISWGKNKKFDKNKLIRLIPRKAKKSRRKKTPGRVLTHDEQVEGRTSAELDLDLEMEFFESLK